MAKTPTVFDDGKVVIKSGTATVTNAKYVNPQINNQNISANKYMILGANVTGNYLCFPYVLSDNSWRIMFLSTDSSNFMKAFEISGTCTFYYVEVA